MTHLYNFYIVVDIPPPPIPSHMTRWLIGHMTHENSGQQITWLLLDDSSIHFLSHDQVICKNSPAHRLSLPRLLPESIAIVTLVWVPSLCVVRADYKLARQFPPELFNTGTVLEQQRSMPNRSQISHWSWSVLSTGKGKFINTTLSYSIFIVGITYIHTSLVVLADVVVFVLWTF
jgi:hypothetical protein